MSVNSASWGEQIRNRIVEELDEATLSLSLTHRTPIASVHDCRRRIKRVRASLRLLRATGPQTLRREDLILADAARRLGPIRDGHVAFLSQPDLALPPPFSHQIRQLVMATTIALNSSASRATRWDVSGIDDKVIETELFKVYRKAWRRWQEAVQTLDSCSGKGCSCAGCMGDNWSGYDHFHDSRKSVKRMYYQLTVLEDIGFFSSSKSRKKRAKYRRTLDALGERLGDHHDLTVQSQVDPARKRKIEKDLRSLGQSVFAVKPKKYRAWIRAQI